MSLAVVRSRALAGMEAPSISVEVQEYPHVRQQSVLVARIGHARPDEQRRVLQPSFWMDSQASPRCRSHLCHSRPNRGHCAPGATATIESPGATAIVWPEALAFSPSHVWSPSSRHGQQRLLSAGSSSKPVRNPMSLAVLRSRALAGMEAPSVSVEVHLANGLPSFTIVGL